jgi:hypothetical protein
MITGPHGFQARVLHWLRHKRVNTPEEDTAPRIQMRGYRSHQLRLPENFDAFEESERAIRESQHVRHTMAPATAPKPPPVSHRVRVKSG